ncbi:amidase [Xanthobacter sp. DSM 24535]|uniref:amidase n=1 Tax=Roseixanthobacter psychrophilus TaxID=3119917 RepID=UPI003728AD12
MGIKDTIAVRGMPSKMNSAVFDETPVRFDAASTYALRQAGAVLLGKTHVPEFAMGKAPPTRNPFDARRTAGGSSSGCGAAVGAAMVPITLGNQTGGSLIRPSSFNANYGFKPTYGALNVAGMHPIAPSQDHIGPMAASLADAWATAWEISSRIGGHNGHPGLSGAPAVPRALKPLRLARLETLGMAQLDDATREAMAQMCHRIAGQGVGILDRECDDKIAILEDLLLEADDVSEQIFVYELRWPLVAYLDANGPDSVSATAKARLDRGLAMTPADYRQALVKRDRIRAQVASVGQQVDGFITLASSGPAPFDGVETGGSTADRPNSHLSTGSRSFLSPWSMVGGPAFSLPLLSVDRMPVGLQVMGLVDTDYRLTAVARWLDEACG